MVAPARTADSRHPAVGPRRAKTVAPGFRATWEHEAMCGRSIASISYVLFVGVLWAVALPGVLIADAYEGLIPWRGPLATAGGVLLAVTGLLLVDLGARTLTADGVGLFGVRPSKQLVTAGVYGWIRNPIDLGATLVAAGSWLALDLALGWVIPVGALVSFVAGVGPYEDRLLEEEFGDAFGSYRSAVQKWLPRGRA